MAEIDGAITELLDRFPLRSCCETPHECRSPESNGHLTIDELDPGDCPRCAIKLAHRLGLAHESHRRDAEANLMNEWGANKREKPTRVEAALAREMPDDVLGGGLDEAMAWLLEPGRVYGWLCNLQIDGFYELQEHGDQIEVIEREFVPATEDRTPREHKSTVDREDISSARRDERKRRERERKQS
jgi:hypothetical protein